MTPLTIYVDFASAAARLAVAPTCALAASLGIVPDWQPCPVEERPMATRGNARGAEHARIRAAYRRREEAYYARVQGLELNYPVGPARVANAALAWANRHGAGDAWTRSAFDAIWAGRLDPDDPAAVEAVLTDWCPIVGFGSFLDAEADAALAANKARALEHGAISVPAYVIRDQLFIGREHLPMIRWLLENDDGTPATLRDAQAGQHDG